MIDLHCHILPELDDGADCDQTTVKMAQTAQENGTTQIICTPHCSTDDPELSDRFRLIRRTVRQTQALLDKKGISVELLCGAELLCGYGLTDALRSFDLLTLADSRYILTEFDFDVRFNYILSAVEEITDYGLIPIIAHPERYITFQRRPQGVALLFERGIPIQINKDSILGSFGSRTAETADAILSHGLAHFVASDAHSDDSRTTGLQSIYELLSEVYSPEYADILLMRNPRRVINNRPLVEPMEG